MAEILSTEIKDDSWASFLRAEVKLDDGQVVWRQVEDHGEVAVVLAYDPRAKTALLVEQFRAPVLYAGRSGVTVEPISGLIDGEETAEAAARREAMEEAGVRLHLLEKVGEVWSSPGISTERMILFLAAYEAHDRVGAGGGLAVEHEDIRVLDVPIAELGRDLEVGRLGDMKLLATVQALKLRRPELFV